MTVINKVEADIYDTEALSIEEIKVLNNRGYEVYIADGCLIIDLRKGKQ